MNTRTITDSQTNYTIRQPGCTSWGAYSTLDGAYADLRRADDVVPGHVIYRDCDCGQSAPAIDWGGNPTVCDCCADD